MAGLAKDGCKQGTIAITYRSVKEACQAVAALHKQIFGGSVVWARQLGGEVYLQLIISQSFLLGINGAVALILYTLHRTNKSHVTQFVYKEEYFSIDNLT